ncbi:hypothetical protein [Rhodococcus sp. B50]|uniref:hypothetical protein n=1 Tax=Rhodococcus sp. B50 TaxID=2682847 RepID=UPI001BD5480F|nr:hypothetical protein [Rhodococcus sp. B50]MBS9375969.1 hypothetical protein [Rhodococcus sp. B50]
MTDLHTMLEKIDALGPPFRIGTRSAANTVSDDAAEVDWFAAAELCDPTSGQTQRMIELHARHRQMPVARHVGSLVFQRYCHRVCGVATAAWVLYGVALDLRAPSVRVRFVAGTPDLLVLDAPKARTDATPEHLLETTVDGHLTPLAQNVRAETGPGMGNLLGNIAAGFAGAFRTLARRSDLNLDAHTLREHAQELLSARPELRRSGDFRILTGPCGPRLQYDRRTCCHWYAAPDGRYCSWCSRLTQEERTKRFQDAMAEE